MKTYGSVKVKEKQRKLEIRLEPQVAIRFKRVFPKIDKTAVGVLQLTLTPETCYELQWFMERFPLQYEGQRKIAALAKQYKEKTSLVERFLTGQQPPLALELAVPAREYQLVAASVYLQTQSLLLADEVGLGKTISAIAALVDPRVRPCVYVTLTHLPRQVQSMIGRFAPHLDTHVIRSGQPYDLTKRGRKGGYPVPDVLIISYSKLTGWAETLAKFAKSVVWDEVQELRRADSNRYRAARILTDAAPFRLGMSATPIYNYGGEIFNVLEAIAPDVLGSWDEFRTEWCSGTRDKSVIRDAAAFGNYMKEAGLMLRRTRVEVKRELPPCYTSPQIVDTDPRAFDEVSDACAALATQLLEAGTPNFDKMRAAQDFDWRLRQATGIAKAVYVAEFVKLIVESGEKVVLYGWHHAVYDIWRDCLKDIPTAMYTGHESVSQKEAAKAAFISGEAKILIMSLRSGAGLDGLQGSCNVIVIGELDWSPGVHEQGIGRVWRDGQANSVNANYMVSEEGSDPFMVEALDIKEQQIEGIRNPDQVGPIEKLQIDPERIKEMARRYLNRKARRVEEDELLEAARPPTAVSAPSGSSDDSGVNDLAALPAHADVPYTLSLFD
ncbi:MAG: SNF2-related protein [Acidobacteriaceae bacterium]